MTTQSRNARIAFYSGLAVLVSAVILLGSCPGAKHWFATTSNSLGCQHSDQSCGRRSCSPCD